MPRRARQPSPGLQAPPGFFEASRREAPQDEDELLMASRQVLTLRSAQGRVSKGARYLFQPVDWRRTPLPAAADGLAHGSTVYQSPAAPRPVNSISETAMR